MRRSARGLASGLALSAGCALEAPAQEPPETFLAFSHDFAGYRAWQSYVPPLALPGNEHVSGPRTVYLNAVPEHGASEFPVGTIFVKESGEGDAMRVFASVKRGGNYNAKGAVGWEWFELKGEPDAPTIDWRGFGPANGDAYGGDATGGCNGCHDAEKWDYSWTAMEFHLLGT